MTLSGKFIPNERKIYNALIVELEGYPFFEKIKTLYPFGVKTSEIVPKSLKRNEADFNNRRGRVVIYDKAVLPEIEGSFSPTTYNDIEDLVDVWKKDKESRVTAKEGEIIRDDGEFTGTGSKRDERTLSIRFDHNDGGWEGLVLLFTEDWKKTGEVETVEYVMPRG